MLRAIKIRLYPNKTQEEYISSLLGSYRFVYNQCLNIKKEKYTQESKNYGLKDLGNFFHQELTKNEEYSWLKMLLAIRLIFISLVTSQLKRVSKINAPLLLATL